MELFYLSDDPGETRNLAASKSDRVDELKGQMEQLAKMAGSHAVSGVEGEINADDAERLRALGYME